MQAGRNGARRGESTQERQEKLREAGVEGQPRAADAGEGDEKENGGGGGAGVLRKAQGVSGLRIEQTHS